jgi:hypothetical protein
MQRLLDLVKLSLVLTALLVVAWSALPGTAQADVQAQVYCEAAGHTCHIVIGNTTYHKEKQPETY